MDKVIRLRLRKDLDNKQYKSVLGLKGSLIAQGYTDIIHISDEGEEFHINSFIALPEDREAILGYIALYLKDKNFKGAVALI